MFLRSEHLKYQSSATSLKTRSVHEAASAVLNVLLTLVSEKLQLRRMQIHVAVSYMFQRQCHVIRTATPDAHHTAHVEPGKETV